MPPKWTADKALIWLADGRKAVADRHHRTTTKVQTVVVLDGQSFLVTVEKAK